MFSLLHIDIPRRASRCAKNNELFSDGNPYFSALIADKEKNIARKDFCSACWKTEEKEHDKHFPYWNGIVHNDPPKKKPKDQTERALFLLKELLENLKKCDSGSPEFSENAKKCFVLALYLLRYRKIVFQKELRDNHEQTLWICTETSSEELVIIPRCTIEPNEVEALRQNLANLLQ